MEQIGAPLALVGLGASLGDRWASLALAVRLLALRPGISLLALSRVYRTPPWGGVARNPFLNAVVLLRTTLDPDGLLRACQHIEHRLGRRAGLRWGDRVLDLDLLWIEHRVIERAYFRLPHPRIAERSFVMRPLMDVLPGAVNPRSGRTFLAEHQALFPRAALPRPVAVGVLPRPPGHKGDRRDTTQNGLGRTP
jgi:2-amino-4-hydroxy-6-hydroxymethyldihydropteridine diphosphokinase